MIVPCLYTIIYTVAILIQCRKYSGSREEGGFVWNGQKGPELRHCFSISGGVAAREMFVRSICHGGRNVELGEGWRMV